MHLERKAAVDAVIEAEGIVAASKQRQVAAILFTYRCSIACRHCLFGCAAARPDVCMEPERCADYLALLHQTGRVIHIAGGEAMLYWDELARSVALAHARGVAPHFVETNCSFASDDAVVHERLRFLAAHGIRGILASADPYHQEHVSPECFLRVRRATDRIFGPQNFYGSRATDDQIRALAGIARSEGALREHVRRHPPNMVGTAQRRLARFLDALPPEHPELPQRGWQGALRGGGPGCRAEFAAETLWELHVDPHGNLQTNCGIILGSIAAVTPAELLARGPQKANPFVELVSAEGAMGLARFARDHHGFVIPAAAVQNCELCYLARTALRPHYPEVFGPAEVYAT